MSDRDLKTLKDGKTYLYAHPENIIGNREVYEVLRTNGHYENKKCFIVVDEAHCMLDWGESFRPIFREIKQLKALCPFNNILALSATISRKGQQEI